MRLYAGSNRACKVLIVCNGQNISLFRARKSFFFSFPIYFCQMLPCQHTYHTSCLQEYITSTRTRSGAIKCPECREEHIITDFTKLQVNRWFNNLAPPPPEEKEGILYCTLPYYLGYKAYLGFKKNRKTVEYKAHCIKMR